MDAHAQHSGHPWRCTPVLRNALAVRQFEFGGGALGHLAAAGTPLGCAALLRHGAAESGGAGGGGCAPAVVGAVRTMGTARDDAVLGLCWLRRADSGPRFVCASSGGRLAMVDGGGALAAFDAAEAAGELREYFPPEMAVVKEYERQKELTCVHISCDDSHMLVSGYTQGA